MMASEEIRHHKKSRRCSNEFSAVEPVSSSTAPTTGTSVEFNDSVLGKILSRKLTLSKYSAVLKRREIKGVSLHDLDALQLDLETLLINTVDRSKALVKECIKLEEKKSDSEHEPSSIEMKTTLPVRVEHREIHVQLTSGFVKFVKSGTEFRKPLPAKPRRLKRKLDELPKSSVPASPGKESKCLVRPSNLGEENASFGKPSNLGEENADLVLQCNVKDNTDLVKPNFTKEINASLAKSHNLADENIDFVKKTHLEAENACEVVPNNLKGNMTLVKRKDSEGNPNAAKRDLIIAKAKPISKPVVKPLLKARSRNKGGSSKSFDSIKRYWQSIYNITRGIFEPDLKALDDLRKNQEAIEKNLKEQSEVGPLFACSWAESELREEKNASSSNAVHRKMPGPVPKDVSCFIKRAEKSLLKARSSADLDLSPLYSQLLSSFIEEGVISPLEEGNEFSSTQQPTLENEVISDYSDFESSMRKDLINIGVLSKDSIVRADTKQETEVDIEIKRVQEELRTLIKCNSVALNCVSKLAKLEVEKQEQTRKLINKGREIERAYQSIVAYRKYSVSLAKKSVEKALVLVKERELILCNIKSIEKQLEETRLTHGSSEWWPIPLGRDREGSS